MSDDTTPPTETDSRPSIDSDDSPPDVNADDDDENAAGDTPDLSALEEQQSWSFEVEGIEFTGSEPDDADADDKIARLIAPSENAQLLYWRAVKYLNDSPEITAEQWQSFTAKNRARIASNHLDEFGVGDFLDEERLDDLREQARGEQNAELEELQNV